MCDKSDHSEHRRSDKGCAVCGGKFGLIRYYSWRTALSPLDTVYCFALGGAT